MKIYNKFPKWARAIFIEIGCLLIGAITIFIVVTLPKVVIALGVGMLLYAFYCLIRWVTD